MFELFENLFKYFCCD